MRDATIAMMAAAILLGAGACGSGSEPPAPPPAAQAPASPAPSDRVAAAPADDRVALAVRIAKEIAENPDQVHEILGRHGMTEKQFEALMFEIAADPDLSRRYSAEMER